MSKYLQRVRSKVKSIIPHSRKKKLDDTYDIRDDIGLGSYAIVKKAIERKTGDSFAIKIYDKFKINHTQRDWIKTEVEILKLYKHPNIISFKEYFDTSKNIYLVMELMTGGDLFDLIKKKKYLTETEACRIITQVLSAVSFLHKNGIIHTDIKADNILINLENDEPIVKLADFGFAQKIGNGTSNTACGTFVYAAPEIIKRQKYDKSADVWSIGVLLYILLCGYPPFFDEDTDKLIEMLDNPVVEFLDVYWCDISIEAKDLVTKMLKVEATQRLSAEEALQHPWIMKHMEVHSENRPSTTTTTTTTTVLDASPSRSTSSKSIEAQKSSLYTENNSTSHLQSASETNSSSSSSSEEEVFSVCLHDGEPSPANSWGG